MVLRPSLVLALGALATLGLAGCGQMVAKPAASADPAALCASPETLAGIKRAILGDIDLTLNTGGGAFYREQIASGAQLIILKPAMTRFDSQSGTVSCAGDAKFIWPGPVAARLMTITPDTDWSSDTSPILYSVQSKPGGGFDYAVQTGGAEIVSMVQSMAATLYQADMKGSQAAKGAPDSVTAPPAPVGAPATPADQGASPGAGDNAPIDEQTRARIDASRAVSGAPPMPH